MPRDHISAISIIVTHCVPARAQYLNGNSRYSSYRYMYVYDIPFGDFSILYHKSENADRFCKLLAQLLKVFLSRVMRCQEGCNSGTGYEDGSTLMFSTTAQF